MVSTADFESAIVGSNPAGTFYNLKKITGFGKVKQTWLTQSVECMPFKHMVKGSSPLLGIYFLKKYNKMQVSFVLYSNNLKLHFK